MTVLPMAFQGKGEAMGNAPVLRDAQGNQLGGTSQRKVELVFEATADEKLKERQMATVAESVRQPLISAGKFFKNGWAPGRGSTGQLQLKHTGMDTPLQCTTLATVSRYTSRSEDQQYVSEICWVPNAQKSSSKIRGST